MYPLLRKVRLFSTSGLKVLICFHGFEFVQAIVLGKENIQKDTNPDYEVIKEGV